MAKKKKRSKGLTLIGSNAFSCLSSSVTPGAQKFCPALIENIRLLLLLSYHCTCSHYLLLHDKLP